MRPATVALDHHLARGLLRNAVTWLELEAERDYFYWELHLSKPVQAARFGDWKAVRNGVDKPIEIYDLQHDAGESVNVAASRPELVAKAHAAVTEAGDDDVQLRAAVEDLLKRL